MVLSALSRQNWLIAIGTSTFFFSGIMQDPEGKHVTHHQSLSWRRPPYKFLANRARPEYTLDGWLRLFQTIWENHDYILAVVVVVVVGPKYVRPSGKMLIRNRCGTWEAQKTWSVSNSLFFYLLMAPQSQHPTGSGRGSSFSPPTLDPYSGEGRFWSLEPLYHFVHHFLNARKLPPWNLL